jgi:trimeric autotransporter adhesin
MKKSIFSLFIALMCFFTVNAQTPTGFKYQAVARDAASKPLVNKTIAVRISILQGSATGSSVYKETKTVKTSDLGLFSLNIGEGNADLSKVDWAKGLYFIAVEMDPAGGTAFQAMGSSQLMSVPFAMYAAKSASSTADADSTNELQNLTWNAATQELAISKGNKINIPLIATPDGDGDAANEIQNLTWNGATQELSISKGNKVTIPLSSGTAGSQITDNAGNTKIQAEASANENRIRFTVQGKEGLTMQRNANGVLQLNFPENTGNIIMGASAGQLILPSANLAEGTYNTVIGYSAGALLKKGTSNTFIGSEAGKLHENGKFNTCVGSLAGPKFTSGDRNTYLGYATAAHSQKGEDNTMIGFSAGGTSNAVGNRNVFIGSFAGILNPGSDNVFLGNNAGYFEAGNNKLFIENTQSNSPLIYGEFDNDFVRINGRLGLEVIHGSNIGTDGLVITQAGVGANYWRMHTNSSDGRLMLMSKAFSATNGATMPVASINPETGVLTSLSDGRYKKDFETLNGALNGLMQLQAFKYLFKGQDSTAKKSVGFVAQSVGKVFPELVEYSKESDAFQLNYGGLSVIAIKAIQEQQAVIDKQAKRIDALEIALNELMKRVEASEKK